MHPVEQRRFEDLVGDALDELPDALAELVDNVVIIVEDQHPDEELLGLYETLITQLLEVDLCAAAERRPAGVRDCRKRQAG